MWGRGMGMDFFFEGVRRDPTNFVSCHCSDHLRRFSSHVPGMFRMRLIPLVFFPMSIKTPPFCHVRFTSQASRPYHEWKVRSHENSNTTSRNTGLGGCHKPAKPSIWRLQSLLMASGFEATESHACIHGRSPASFSSFFDGRATTSTSDLLVDSLYRSSNLITSGYCPSPPLS